MAARSFSASGLAVRMGQPASPVLINAKTSGGTA